MPGACASWLLVSHFPTHTKVLCARQKGGTKHAALKILERIQAMRGQVAYFSNANEAKKAMVNIHVDFVLCQNTLKYDKYPHPLEISEMYPHLTPCGTLYFRLNPLTADSSKSVGFDLYTMLCVSCLL